jgi:hypothetical protein
MFYPDTMHYHTRKPSSVHPAINTQTPLYTTMPKPTPVNETPETKRQACVETTRKGNNQTHEHQHGGPKIEPAPGMPAM